MRFTSDGLIERAAVLGERMLNRFKKALAGDNHVVDIRGRGLMLAIELDAPCPHLVKRRLRQDLLINVTHDTCHPSIAAADSLGRPGRRDRRPVVAKLIKEPVPGAS